MSAASRLRNPHVGWGAALTLVLLGSFALRVWGVKQGLPFAYNADENAHFVPKAIGLFGHGWNPHYFVNPPAFTYLLHGVLAAWYGGRSEVSQQFATDPTQVYVIARVTAAVLGTLAVWLTYFAAARFFDRRVGLLAASLLGVSFLPVFYSHLALNDGPTLAPIALSLFGTAGVLRHGRLRDYAIAGVGLGLACASKYTGGIVVLPLIGAAAVQFLAPGGRRYALIGLGAAAAASLIAFLAANPYALLSFSEFKDDLVHQSTASDDALGKLGLTQSSGILYYLWTLTWGLGWIPALCALGGSVALWFDERRLLAVLVPAPVVFILFMGTQGRYFGRWLMPILPILCVLGAWFALELAERAGWQRPRLRPTLIALAAVALLGQGLVYSIHAGLVLSRPDTRNLTRDWMVAHIPTRSKVVIEPVVPDAWAQDIGRPSLLTANGHRWVKYRTSRSQITNLGKQVSGPGRVVNIQDYERTTRPGLIDAYEAGGYCWVVTGSTQSGRAFVEPGVVPQAIQYYAALDRRGLLVYHASPYGKGEGPVDFNFDWSFDFYPLAYDRPGPDMKIYRLKGRACKRV